MRMICLALALLPIAGPAAAEVRFLDCSLSKEPGFCRQAQAQYTEERRKAPRAYGTMRNVAFCLWTGCDGAMQIDRKASCVIRRGIMQLHPAQVDRSDEVNFASCVNAGY